MKRNINKKRMFISLLLSTVATCSVVSFGLMRNSPSISRVESNNQALEENGSSSNTTQSGTTYSVTQKQKPSGKYANQITQKELQSLLTPADTTVKFSVVILPITETNLNQGSIDFLIFEQLKQVDGTYKTSFAKAASSPTNSAGAKETKGAQSDNTISESVLKQYTDSNNSQAKQENVFSTSKFENLSDWITKKTYKIVWQSDSVIENYIKNKEDELTASDVWYNLVDNSQLPPLDLTNSASTSTPSTQISVTKVVENNTSGNGLYKIEITLKNVTSTEKAENNTSTRYLGGFLDNGVRTEFEITGDLNIGSITITDGDLFNSGDSTAKAGTKLSDLTPSEFASPNGGTQKLIQILTSGTGLTNTPKILTMSYGNIKNIPLDNGTQSQSIDSDTTITKQNVQNSLRITNIDTVPNDSDGSLQLVIYYNTFDVYTGSIKSKVTTFNFPTGTFKINPNADKDLFITWKTASALENMNYSYEVVNEYYRNRNNAEFARIFSNKFLETTDAVKAMNRTVEINYGNIDGTESNGTLVSSEDKTVRVKLTFNSWGSTGKTFTIENTFTLDGYRYESDGTPNDALTFVWKDNDTLFNDNKQYSELTPTDVALLLMNNSTTIYQTFVLGADASQANNVQIAIKPDDENGTMTVYLRKSVTNGSSTVISPSTHIYQQLYVGFKKTSKSSNIVSFAFPPQSEVSNELLAIPLTSVTKEDVMNLYLKNIDLFKDKTLTEDDVEITPVINENGESYLIVKVVISSFNQDSSPTIDKQTFYTTITGFSTTSYINNTEFNPPKDFTAIISISSAVSISIILGTVLIALFIKRAQVRVYKKNDEILK